MKKKNLFIIFIIIILLVICCLLFLAIRNSKYNKNPEHLEDMTYYKTEEYQAIVWNNRTYVPFCAIENSKRGKWIGIIDSDENNRVYEYKEYSTNEWLILLNKVGVDGESILFKEKNVTDIPEGLQSEYEWNRKELSKLDKFYSNQITKNYKDIRELDKNYNIQEAQKDNCFVIGAMVHNDYLYNDFMKSYNNNDNAFIRIAQTTVEGDVILTDIMYDNNESKLISVLDSTRDRYSSEEDRKIELREYESISEYEYKNHLYLVLYNGKLNDDTFENAFVVTKIN